MGMRFSSWVRVYSPLMFIEVGVRNEMLFSGMVGNSNFMQINTNKLISFFVREIPPRNKKKHLLLNCSRKKHREESGAL